MTRALIVVGPSGWIGSQIVARHPGAIGVSPRVLLRSGVAATLDQLGPLVRLQGATVVNASGAKSAGPDELTQVNTTLVGQLARTIRERGGRLIQIGSAAEYGLDPTCEWVDEQTPCMPTSDYGKTKLAGTMAALESGVATVLRPFNIASNPAQVGSPLEDIVARINLGVTQCRPIELLSPGTKRDYVTLSFVLDSIDWAIANGPTGLYNLATGSPIRISDFAQELATRLGSNSSIVDLKQFPATTISADPTPWLNTSGLSSTLDAAAMAEMMLNSNNDMIAGSEPDNS